MIRFVRWGQKSSVFCSSISRRYALCVNRVCDRVCDVGSGQSNELPSCANNDSYLTDRVPSDGTAVEVSSSSSIGRCS